MNTSLILVSVCLLGGTPDAWPGFLGAGASPVDAQSLPLKWSTKDNIAWKAELTGKGQSSPVIWGDKVFVTSIDGEMKETCVVTALELKSGEILWKHTLESPQKVRGNYFQSRSASTPVVDAEGVYAFFETGNVIALSLDGKPAWSRSLVKDYGEFISTIGLASSPLQVGDAVVLLIDHEGPSYLLALDKQTGETRWKTDRDSRKSYASPVLVKVGGMTQIVCSSDGTVDGYDPQSGELLWSFDEVGGNTAITPQAFIEGRFVMGASPGMHGEREADAKKSNLVMSIEKTSAGYEPKVVWRTEKALPAFASPMVFRGHAYWVNRVGVLYCFDAETGEQRYAERIKQMCWATPVGIGDRLYCFGKDGVTTVVAAGPEFKVLAENSLWDPLPGTEERPDQRGHEEHGASKAKGLPAGGAAEAPAKPAEKPAEAGSVRPMGGRPGGGAPADGKGPRGLMFADPVQYGVAVVNGSIVVRTGQVVYCLREPQAQVTAK